MSDKITDYADKYLSRKLWFGVIAPAWLLTQGYVSDISFTIIASVSIGGMALVDAVRAYTGESIDAWRKGKNTTTLPAPSPNRGGNK